MTSDGKSRTKRLSPLLITAVLVLLALAHRGLGEAFPHLLRRHALKAASPYFLPACVACALTPLLAGILYASYWTLYQRKRKDRENSAKDLGPRHLSE